MYCKKRYIVIVSLIIIFVALNSFSIIHAESVIDEKFLKFLLTEDEVPGPVLQKQSPDSWRVTSHGSRDDNVYQIWTSNNGATEILLVLGIFDSEENAIKGMNYYTHTTSSFWNWGSFDSGILGDHSWISASIKDSAGILTAYGNIGVLIDTAKGYDQDAILKLSNAQITKIDQNLSSEIIGYREILRQSRLSPAEYDKFMAETVNVSLSGFSKISDGDSLWLEKDEGIRMGIRKEWEDDQHRVVGVDICKVESGDTASEIASERAKMSNGKTVTQFSTIPWNNARLSEVLIRGSVAVHLYYFNHNKTFEPAVTPPYSPPPPYGPPVPISYLYPYPYNTYSTYLGIAPYFQPLPVRLSASSFNNPFVSYPYSLSVYNTVPPRVVRGGTASFVAGLFNTYNMAYSPYSVSYFNPWKYYPFTSTNIPIYNSDFYPYGVVPIFR